LNSSFEKFPGDDYCYKKECGNNIINSNEECDDGNNLSGDGCSVDCKNETVGYYCNYTIPQNGT
jgi:cysteine-rich repeat protein